MDKRKLEVRTPDVKIQVDPQRGDLVETRIIDGVGYVLIRAEGGVEDLMLHVRGLTDDEREILLDGCLINYYRNNQ